MFRSVDDLINSHLLDADRFRANPSPARISKENFRFARSKIDPAKPKSQATMVARLVMRRVLLSAFGI
jgi:hypothetical protein